MKMALKDGVLFIKDFTPVQESVIKSWNLMRFDRKNGLLIGQATMDLLSRLSKIVQLPAPIQDELSRMSLTQKAVDYVRTEPDPKELYRFPVKKKLYKHQIRAGDMALLTFGLIPAEEAFKDAADRKGT